MQKLAVRLVMMAIERYRLGMDNTNKAICAESSILARHLLSWTIYDIAEEYTQ